MSLSSSSLDRMNKLADEMNASAKAVEPFTTTELDVIISSLEEILPPETVNNTALGMEAIRSLLLEVGHLPHSDWDRTANSAARLRNLLLPEGEGLSGPFRYMFNRILTEGNWDGAVANTSDEKPWAVLVTGLNGVRKTTSVYQPWFQQVLKEAMVSPTTGNDSGLSPPLHLPTGQNSFFRQLDHMIASLVNRHFLTLYKLTSQTYDSSTPPPVNVIKAYSKLKASLFTRYRTLSEIFGILLIREAQHVGSNVMLETSGRNVAMFHYIDEFFPADKYRKLVLRFTINDIRCAEKSVDVRMVKEMTSGGAVMKQDVEGAEGSIDVRQLIRTNLGGPYGSEVLLGVQQDSDRVWEGNVVGDGATVGADWYKACIQIDADAMDPEKDWTANAIKEDGTSGASFAFEKPPSL